MLLPVLCDISSMLYALVMDYAAWPARDRPGNLGTWRQEEHSVVIHSNV